jgi:predicted transcriptional regulator
MKLEKKSTSIRLSDEARRLVTELAKKLGVHKSSILEMAIRKLAEKEGLK